MNPCQDHSGFKADIQSLKEFKEKQDGKAGVNEKLFDKLDEIAGKQNWMLGGLAALVTVIGIAVALLRIKQ